MSRRAAQWRISWWEGPTRPLVFIVVGCGGFVLQALVLAVLTSWAAWPVVPATAIAIECAILGNFFWHERWTWADRVPDTSRAERLLRFHAANGAASLAGGVAITWMAAEGLGLPVIAANALSVAIMAAANYRAADRWVFRQAGHAVRITWWR